jgi:hypothetical protein
MGHSSQSIFERTPGSRYLLTEGRETPAEIKASKTSPGEGMAAGTNRAGAVYAWLLSDFAVGGAELKPGHKAYLSGIAGEVAAYGRLHARTGTVMVAGFASPSGVHAMNKTLVTQRAANVIDELTRNGIHRDWCFTGTTTGREIYAVVRGIPSTPKLRAYCRGVYIVLWLQREIPAPEKFSGDLRSRARERILGRFPRNEENFYYWAVDNWAYLISASARYAQLAYPPQDGLFFRQPESTLKDVEEAWVYLQRLHREFLSAANRLKQEYTGVPQSSALPAGGDPVRCYQQLARWIALDIRARSGSSRVFDFMPGAALTLSMAELTSMINKGKFGDPNTVWTRIEQYIRSKQIPYRVVRRPES